MPIDFGGGMIFPNSYNADPPDPPECPCEDGEPCAAHRPEPVPETRTAPFTPLHPEDFAVPENHDHPF